MASSKEEIIAALENLPEHKLDRVLEFVRSVSDGLPPGIPPEAWEPLWGVLSPEAGEELARVIEEGCEQIDPRDWDLKKRE